MARSTGSSTMPASSAAADAVDFTVEDWDDVMNVNLKSTFFLAQAFARHFSRRDGAERSSISLRC